MNWLPPLTALRAFEAVGRFGVAGAARDLNVTRAAILYQLRVLETELGVSLFERSNRGLNLSKTGEQYLAEVTKSFEALHESARRLNRGETEQHLILDSLTGFATDFIVPRLHRFYAANPQITLEIKALQKWFGPIEFERTGANVAIRASGRPGEFGELHVEKLCHERHFPVCAPAMRDRIKRPEDLADMPLLDSTIAPEGWRDWIAAAEREGHDLSRVTLDDARRFDLFYLSMIAAVEGVGVELGRSPMVDHWIDEGRLVPLFELSVLSRSSYWLVCRREFADRPEFVAFRLWLRAELDALGRDLLPAA